MAVDIVIGFDSLALVFAIGLALTQAIVIPAAGFQTIDLDALRSAAIRYYALCLAVLWLTSLAWLWTRTAAMSGQAVWDALPMVPTVLLRSHFGAVWWLRVAALILATLALLPMSYRQSRVRWSGFALLVFGLAWVAASRSAAGHAAAEGDWTVREAMDWLHLVSISVWGGSLIACLVLVFPRLRRVSHADRVHFAIRFSLVATWALAAVLTSGIYNASQTLPTVSAIWNSHFGRLLALKLLFVAGMVACGAINHYRLVPQLRGAVASDDRAIVRQLRALVRVEAVLLLVVLAITAVLLGSEPPAV